MGNREIILAGPTAEMNLRGMSRVCLRNPKKHGRSLGRKADSRRIWGWVCADGNAAAKLIRSVSGSR